MIVQYIWDLTEFKLESKLSAQNSTHCLVNKREDFRLSCFEGQCQIRTSGLNTEFKKTPEKLWLHRSKKWIKK